MLIWTPISFGDLRVEMIEPPLSALLAKPEWDGFGDAGPFVWAYVPNQLDEEIVLVLCPWPLLH